MKKIPTYREIRVGALKAGDLIQGGKTPARVIWVRDIEVGWILLNVEGVVSKCRTSDPCKLYLGTF